jgi:hypothetical protein
MRRGETQSDVSRSPDLLMKQLVLHRSLLSIRQSCRGRLLADGGDIANLGYCVTGTEGSNPSLSANESLRTDTRVHRPLLLNGAEWLLLD